MLRTFALSRIRSVRMLLRGLMMKKIRIPALAGDPDLFLYR